MSASFWRKCSVCKNEIGFSKVYFVCSVSSCNLKRSPTQFCSVSCWDAHNAVLNHKSAGAEEERSPAVGQEAENKPRRRIVSQSSSGPARSSSGADKEVLVVVSKLKAYIKAQSDMNTSADVMPVLSDFLRDKCDEAVERAKLAGRKTVMGRDF